MGHWRHARPRGRVELPHQREVRLRRDGDRLGVPVGHAVLVGDDERDVAGAGCRVPVAMRRTVLCRRSPSSAPISSDTSSSISSATTALTASRITSACSSKSTFLTTSSIVIVSAPVTRRLLSSSPRKPDDLRRRVGPSEIPSEPDLHHATGRDPPGSGLGAVVARSVACRAKRCRGV